MRTAAVFPQSSRPAAGISLIALSIALLASDGRSIGLYAGCVAALVICVARTHDDLFPAACSTPERRGWSGVYFGVLILLSFAHLLWLELRDPGPAFSWQARLFERFGWNLVMLLLAACVVHHLLGARRATGDRGECESRIAHEGAVVANTLLVLVMLALVVMLALYPDVAGEWLQPRFVANVLIALLIVRTLAEQITIVARHRRLRR